MGETRERIGRDDDAVDFAIELLNDGRGVRAGAAIPYQIMVSAFLIPLSLSVGTSANCDRRLGAAMAMMRSLPALSSESAEARVV